MEENVRLLSVQGVRKLRLVTREFQIEDQRSIIERMYWFVRASLSLNDRLQKA